jgi:hypothetical protein
MTPRNTPVSERFWSKVIGGDVEHCWLWNAGKNPEGYGVFYINNGGHRQHVKAHRWAYEALRAEIPVGLHIDHLCRHHACVNPWHLEPVSPRENVLRGESPSAIALRREYCTYGHHDFAAHGIVWAGRRICRTCRLAYNRLYKALSAEEISRRKAAGLPLIDLVAYYAESAA